MLVTQLNPTTIQILGSITVYPIYTLFLTWRRCSFNKNSHSMKCRVAKFNNDVKLFTLNLR